MEPRISIITLGVQDLTAAYNFYYHGYFTDLDGYLWEVAYGEMWQFNADGSLIIN